MGEISVAFIILIPAELPNNSRTPPKTPTMTQVSIAILVDQTGNRYRLKSWRSGSRSTSAPKRAATLYEKAEDAGWEFLDNWNAAVSRDGSTYYDPKPDHTVLREAMDRIQTAQGVTIDEVILDTSNGWGHNASTDPDIDDDISIKTI